MSNETSFKLPESWKYPAIIIACIVVVYLQALRFDFVNYDDNYLVTNNTEFLGKVSSIFKSFTTHAFTSEQNAASVYYRPVLLVSYILDYQIWRLNPLGFHLMNIVYHSIASIILFFFVQRLLKNDLVALFTAILFAVHPVQTEAVAWIAGRNDVLLGLFIILMMYYYLLQYENPEQQQVYFWLSAGLFCIALFTKESAAFFIVLIPIFDLLFQLPQTKTLSEENSKDEPQPASETKASSSKSFNALFEKKQLIQYAVFAGILISYLAIRFSIFGEFIGAEKLYGHRSTPGERILQAPGMVAEHLKLFLAPVSLCITHPLSVMPWFHSPGNILAILITIALLVLIFWTWKRDKFISFGLLWLSIGLIPVLNIFPLAVPVLEHRLYAVAPGFGLILSRGFYLLFGELKIKEYNIVLIVLASIMALLSLFRLPAWRSSETLLTDAIAKAPTVGRSYFNLAGYYFDNKQYEKTIEIINKYNAIEPGDIFVYSKLRDSYLFLGRYEEAVQTAKKMISFQPKNPDLYIAAGQIYRQLGMIDSTILIYISGLKEDSTMYQLHVRLGALFEEYTETPMLAERYYRASISIAPEFGPAYFRLGRLLTIQGDTLQAIQVFEDGMKNWLPPKEVLTFLNVLYEQTGQHEKASALIKKFSGGQSPPANQP